MRNEIKVGIVGSAVFAPRHSERTSLEEALHAVTHAALRDAGLAIEDIDGVVVAGNDELDGRAITVMMASGSVGGVGRDVMATPSSAEHAFVLGALRVRSGIYRTNLIVSWSPLETEDISEVQRLSADPYFHRALPLDDLSTHALHANVLESKVPNLRAAAVSVVETNRRHGAHAHPEYAPAPREKVNIERGKMLRYPITEGMVARPAFAAVAMVVASDEFIAERKCASVAWVQGMGWATELAWLGDRDLSTLPSLDSAVKQAYRESSTDVAKPDFDLAEVADATPYQQLVAIEALGLSSRERLTADVLAGAFAKEGAVPVNLSGGAQSFNPLFCTGLISIAEVASQIRGKAGAHQKADVKKAVAHAASGCAMQYNTVVVLGREALEQAQ